MSVAASYSLIARNLDRSLAVTANQAPVKLETAYYREHYGDVTSIDEFLADSRLFRYAMTAFGLADLAYAKGYIRKILEEGVTDPDSLANRTSDQRLREFARVFDFESYGDLTMKRVAAGEAVVDRYVRQTLETDAGSRDGDGVRLALYFARMAPEIDNAFDILADSALSEVVRTLLGLPTAFAAVDIDRQAEVLTERLDIASLKDPAEVDRLLTRFTALWDAAESGASDPVLSLFGITGNTSPTISLDLALSLNSLRLGGL
ncbi:DUF1217 domain-containing protein [Acuticoccus mangrovi]|uniref:DUF1217 domain-containing protein n=1 Tax=Acuticoccus mangrovi TaxID=2796142 RepID=A0A934ITW8_9HYPH|nr:DUF1217 domain-containing protein [Acuticoccus mangrovi]MBJ3778670.1 DUF1217 domain-containing protein [Acuticoccus mangrovi]